MIRAANKPATCGVADWPVGGPDLGCPEPATRLVVYRCPHPGHGRDSRTVCDHHERVLATDPAATCEFCAKTGDLMPLQFLHSTEVTP